LGSDKYTLALKYAGQGRWKEAEELLIQVVETNKRVIGHEHPNTLTSMHELALTYMSPGRWKEAEKLLIQVVETKKRVIGHEHPDTLTSMEWLAYTYNSQGRIEEATAMSKQVADLRPCILHPVTARVQKKLEEWSGDI
jgi:tetratricopeptide (TPR) repeat protein